MDITDVCCAIGGLNRFARRRSIASLSAPYGWRGFENRRDEMPVPREALPNRQDLREVLEIALSRAWRADSNVDVSIKELDRAMRMYEVWRIIHDELR